MKRLLLTALVPVTLALSGPVHADIYAFVDGNGIRHLSNVPNDPRYKLVMRTPVYRKEDTRSSSFAPSNVYGAVPWKGQRGYGQTYARPRSFSRVNEQNRQRFAADVNRIAAQHQLEPALVHAVISAESSYNPWAVSPKGAMGLMQLMPGTAERFGVGNPYDPISNVNGGARYLRWLLNQFNDTRLAVAAYNAGEGAVQKYGNQIPPYRETQNYVVRVLDFYQRYKGGGLYNANTMTAYNTYNTPYNNYNAYNPSAAGNPLTYNTGYQQRPTTRYASRSRGTTLITPRNSTLAPGIVTVSRNTATAARSTYLLPTGNQMIVGASGAGYNGVRRPLGMATTYQAPTSSSPVTASAPSSIPAASTPVASIPVSAPTSPGGNSTLFGGNDK